MSARARTANPHTDKKNDRTSETPEQRKLRYMEEYLDGNRDYLTGLAAHFALKLIKSTGRTTNTALQICKAAETNLEITNVNGAAVEFPQKKSRGADPKKTYYGRSLRKVDPKDWQTLEAYFQQDAAEADIAAHDSNYRNIERLTNLLNLTEVEKECMRLLYVIQQQEEFGGLVRGIFNDDLKQASVGFARMLGKPQDAPKIMEALHFSGRLATYGLIMIGDESDSPNSIPVIEEDLVQCLDKPDMSDEEIVAVILGKKRTTDLVIDDYKHIGEPLEYIAKIIKSAIQAEKKGINILLYGPAGSGKTELAAAIAKSLDLNLYAVGEDDESAVFAMSAPHETTSRKRIAQLGRSQALLKGGKDSLILFDEIEDLLIKGGDSRKSADTESKIEINRMLEENPVVTIWTGNEPEKLIEAVRQRMTYSIYMDYPPTLVRENIWRRRLELEKCSLPDSDIRDLSRRYAPPPRLISKAVEVMAMTGGDVRTIEETILSASRLSTGQADGVLVDDAVPPGFDIGFLNAEGNLRETFNRLVNAGKDKQPFTLLVENKPGLGSEELLRLMAEEMSMNIIEVNIEDLMTSSPMQSAEMKIKGIFDAAVNGRSFLILNGLEKAVSNPQSAASAQEWNASEMNVLIKEALNHRLPLAVTVNQKVRLPDHISLIFSDKIRLQPISREQGQELYKNLIGEAMPGEFSSALDGAMPDDFIRLKSIMAKVASSNGPDHGRTHDLLTRMKSARTEQANGIGFVRNLN